MVRREDAVGVVREAGGDVVLVDGDDLADRVAEATGGAEIRLGIDAVGGPRDGPPGGLPVPTARRWSTTAA